METVVGVILLDSTNPAFIKFRFFKAKSESGRGLHIYIRFTFLLCIRIMDLMLEDQFAFELAYTSWYIFREH